MGNAAKDLTDNATATTAEFAPQTAHTIGDIENVSVSSIVIKQARQPTTRQSRIPTTLTIALATLACVGAVALATPKPSLIPVWTPGKVLAKSPLAKS